MEKILKEWGQKRMRMVNHGSNLVINSLVMNMNNSKKINVGNRLVIKLGLFVETMFEKHIMPTGG